MPLTAPSPAAAWTFSAQRPRRMPDPEVVHLLLRVVNLLEPHDALWAPLPTSNARPPNRQAPQRPPAPTPPASPVPPPSTSEILAVVA